MDRPSSNSPTGERCIPRGSRPASTSLDGLLGTGDYELRPGESDTHLLTQMMARFNTQAASLNLTARSAALG